MKKVALGITLLLSLIWIVSCGMKVENLPAVYTSAFDKTRKVLPPDGGTIGSGGNPSTGTSDGGNVSVNDIFELVWKRVCPTAQQQHSVSPLAIGEAPFPVVMIRIPSKNFQVVVPLVTSEFTRREMPFTYKTRISIPKIPPSEFGLAQNGSTPGQGNGAAGFIEVLAFNDQNQDGIRQPTEVILTQGGQSRNGVPTLQAGSPNIYSAEHHVYANRSINANRGQPTDLCESFDSPLVLDLTGEGFQFSPPSAAPLFDINADGYLDKTGWLSSLSNFSNGFLARDLNRNGMIDDGSELFGNHTVLPNGENAANGFEGLLALDSNGDGYFDAADAAFNELVIWRDFNLNGVSESYEMQSLSSLQIIRINIKDYINLMEADQYGNLTRQRSSYTRLVDGQEKELQIIDIWFRTEE